MKPFFKTLFMGAFVLSLLSCDKVNELADITFQTTFEDDFSVDITTATEPDGSAVFMESGTIDLTQGDVKDYIDKLKNIKIIAVKINFSNYIGAATTTFTGQIDVGGGFVLNIPVTNIQDAFDNATEIDLTEQAGAFNYMKDQLLANKKLDYALNGVVSEVPVQADFKLIYTLDVTANPL